MENFIYLGQMIHQWTVLYGPFQKFNRIKHWTCRCICGNIRDIKDYSLRTDRSHNCGCTRIVTEETRRALSAKRKAQPPPWEKGRKRPPEVTAKMLETKRLNKLRKQGEII